MIGKKINNGLKKLAAITSLAFIVGCAPASAIKYNATKYKTPEVKEIKVGECSIIEKIYGDEYKLKLACPGIEKVCSFYNVPTDETIKEARDYCIDVLTKYIEEIKNEYRVNKNE